MSDIEGTKYDPNPHIEELIETLEIDGEIASTARDLGGKLTDDTEWWMGNSPSGMAAAAVYVAVLQGQNGPLQREIADAADVSGPTIRKHYREIGQRYIN